MKVCIAGTAPFSEITEKCDIPFLLESFYYIKDWQLEYIRKHCRFFVLDSGAFTFMCNTSIQIDWLDYVDRYAKFILENDIKYFFELDIDNVIGYDKVKDLRRVLEAKTGRKCIPVWHKGRGVEEYKRLCKEYSYIAIGGIVSGEIKSTEYDNFIPLLKYAHKHKCKVHGLGFTSMGGMKKYHFDSVDSTSWTGGGRWGAVNTYQNGAVLTHTKESGLRCKREAALLNNLQEWIKFQKYAERCL